MGSSVQGKDDIIFDTSVRENKTKAKVCSYLVTMTSYAAVFAVIWKWSAQAYIFTYISVFRLEVDVWALIISSFIKIKYFEYPFPWLSKSRHFAKIFH